LSAARARRELSQALFACGAGPGLVLGIELKRQPALSHKLEVMPSGGPLKPEEIETWQVRAEADLGELVIRVHSQ
jgi:hypothetical protein